MKLVIFIYRHDQYELIPYFIENFSVRYEYSESDQDYLIKFTTPQRNIHLWARRIEKVISDEMGVLSVFDHIQRESVLRCPECGMEYEDGVFCRADGMTLQSVENFSIKEDRLTEIEERGFSGNIPLTPSGDVTIQGSDNDEKDEDQKEKTKREYHPLIQMTLDWFKQKDQEGSSLTDDEKKQKIKSLPVGLLFKWRDNTLLEYSPQNETCICSNVRDEEQIHDLIGFKGHLNAIPVSHNGYENMVCPSVKEMNLFIYKYSDIVKEILQVKGMLDEKDNVCHLCHSCIFEGRSAAVCGFCSDNEMVYYTTLPHSGRASCLHCAFETFSIKDFPCCDCTQDKDTVYWIPKLDPFFS